MTSSCRTARLFAFFVRRKILGAKPSPTGQPFKLTYRCNLACLACPFHRRAAEERSHMSWQEALNALTALKKAGTPIVVFEGGEPFAWKDGEHGLEDLVCQARKDFPCVAVTTNGTFPLATSADLLWVSLDGLKENHDRLRSRSFDRVWSNLRTVRKQRFLVHFTINQENRQDLRPLLSKLRSVEAFPGHDGPALLSLWAGRSAAGVDAG